MKPSVCCGFLILYGSLCLYWQIVYVQWKAFVIAHGAERTPRPFLKIFRSFIALAKSFCPVLFLYFGQHFVKLPLLFLSLSQFFVGLFFRP